MLNKLLENTEFMGAMIALFTAIAALVKSRANTNSARAALDVTTSAIETTGHGSIPKKHVTNIRNKLPGSANKMLEKSIKKASIK